MRWIIRQNVSRSAPCMVRGLPAVVMVPAFTALTCTTGSGKFAWFMTLNVSQRNCRLPAAEQNVAQPARLPRKTHQQRMPDVELRTSALRPQVARILRLAIVVPLPGSLVDRLGVTVADAIEKIAREAPAERHVACI